MRYGGLSLLRRPTAELRVRVPKAENITRLRPYGRASKKMGKTPQRQGTYPLYRVPQPLRQMRHAWPEMFNAPDAEWKHYVEPRMQGEMLCVGVLHTDKGVD